MARNKIPLTPEIQKAIVEAVADGCTRHDAAGAAGVSEFVLYAWIRKGKKARSGVYHQFYKALKRAEAEAVNRNVRVIKKASETTWTAAAWWLERRRPRDFGRVEDRVAAVEKKLKALEAGRADAPGAD